MRKYELINLRKLVFFFVNDLLIFSGKLIERCKFDLHEAFCLRNIIKCPVCEEPLMKSDLEDHKQEFHTKVIL